MPTSRDDLLELVRRYAERPDARYTCEDFLQRMGLSRYPLRRHFPGGGWADLLDAAGMADRQRFQYGGTGSPLIPAGQRRRGADSVRRWSRARLVAALKQFALENPDSPLTQQNFCNWVPVTPGTVRRYCPDGGWYALKREAGLQHAWVGDHPNQYRVRDMLECYGEIRRKYGGNRPLLSHLDRHAAFSTKTIYNRFGSLDALHEAWEHYDRTGEIPPDLPRPRLRPACEPLPSLAEEVPLGPLPPGVTLRVHDLIRYAREHKLLNT